MENTVKLSSCSKILHLHKKIMTTIGINCCYVCMRETGCCQEGVYYLLIWEFPSSIKGKIIWTNKLTNRQTDRQTNRQTYWSIIEGYLWKCENVIFMNKFIDEYKKYKKNVTSKRERHYYNNSYALRFNETNAMLAWVVIIIISCY